MQVERKYLEILLDDWEARQNKQSTVTEVDGSELRIALGLACKVEKSCLLRERDNHFLQIACGEPKHFLEAD